MKTLMKAAAALVLGLSVLGVSAASAEHRDRDGDRYSDRRDDDRGRDRHRRDSRPDRCHVDHDHRNHQRDYYDYYPKDRYYRADPSFSISLRFGDHDDYERRRRYNDRPYYDRRGYRDGGRVIRRDRYGLRGYRADAFLIEEVYGRGRRGGALVCTVTARGPDARYVPYRYLRRLAERKCSRRAQVRVYA